MKKCLIVDDVEVTRFTSEQIMKTFGSACLSAETVDQAIDLIQKEDIGLILLDWHLRHRSGLDVLKAARAAKGTQVKIVIFSGIEGPEKEQELKEAGADAFLEKPTTKDKLEQCLRRIGAL